MVRSPGPAKTTRHEKPGNATKTNTGQCSGVAFSAAPAHRVPRRVGLYGLESRRLERGDRAEGPEMASEDQGGSWRHVASPIGGGAPRSGGERGVSKNAGLDLRAALSRGAHPAIKRHRRHVRRGALARTTVKAGRRLARLVQVTARFPFKLFVILSQCRAAACQHWPAHARCETRSYMYTLRGREGIFLQLSRTSRPALPYRIAVYSCAINHQTWLPRAGERQSSCLSLTPTSTQRHYRQKHS